MAPGGRLCPGRPAGWRLGSVDISGTWTDGDYDYPQQAELVEICCFLCLAVLGLLFELGHHHLHHYLEHTIELNVLRDFGQPHGSHSHHLLKHQLMGGNRHAMALFNRISAEMMVLGFIALTCWIVYQCKMFQHIADDLAGTYTSSPDYYFIYNMVPKAI